jgi:hypothetical protein
VTGQPGNTIETAAGDALAATFSDYARRYAELGWALIRANGKKPQDANWQQTAPAEPGFAAGQWARWGDRYNVGVALGSSRLCVFEYDRDDARDLFLEVLGGKLPRTPIVRTGSGKAHVYFADPGGIHKGARDGLELRVGGHHCLLPPSTHPDTGRKYAWLEGCEPWAVPLLAVPAAVLEFFRAETRRNGKPAARIADVIPEGARRHELLKVAGRMKRLGLTADEILVTLQAVNRRCEQPLDEAELASIAGNDTLGPDPDARIRTAPVVERQALEDVVATFRRWLYLPDPGALYVTLATVAANRLPGDPLWFLLVAASSSGKTEILFSLGGLPEVEPAATLTEAALLSGVSRKDRDQAATGGLLPKIGRYGILTLKDFGSILSMHRDARAATLAALRECYDGSWDRPVGVDGGRTLHWDGKLGLIAGVTTVVDRHHAVMDSLGSRFALYRVEVDDRKQQAGRALRHRRVSQQMRDELRDAVSGLFASIDLGTVLPLTETDEERLVTLADFVTLARSPVKRDAYATREIELVPDPEAPARFVNMLASLLDGLRLIGLDDDTAWTLTAKTAFDSMPAQRRKVLAHLHSLGDHDAATTRDMAIRLGLPTTTTRRVLEDLNAHGLVRRRDGDTGDEWLLSRSKRLGYTLSAIPEMSGKPPSISPDTVQDDKSGMAS